MQYGTTQVVKKGHLNRFFTNFLRDKLWGEGKVAECEQQGHRGAHHGILLGRFCRITLQMCM